MPCEPPMGFSPPPMLGFWSDSKFPTANTCTNTFFVPLDHVTYEDFLWHMCYGIVHTAGFGDI